MSQPRTPAEVLREARHKDSRDKRGRVLAVVDQLLAANEPVTFTGVARAANVSHWLVYADGVREHIEVARRRQTRTAANDARAGATAPPGWKVEQQLLQQDNRRLREEVERLKAAVRRNLGQQLDQFGAADLGTRVDELTADNHRLQNDLDNAQALITDLTGHLNEAQDDLTAARTSIRQLIRAENTTGATQ
jgi:formylglycine-generating enzyme required for sulfatase activity